MYLERAVIILRVVSLIPQYTGYDCTLIGIDGPCGAGKTTFTNELSIYCRQLLNKSVIRISIDDFHYPKSKRCQQGRK